MNSNQTHLPQALGQINRAFSPPNYELLSEERELRTPGRESASTIINVHSYEPPANDFLVWSVFNTLYMNFCCLGFMALVFSVKARDRKVVGDLNGARSYGSTAKCLNIFALIFSLLIVIVLTALLATGIIALKRVVTNPSEIPHYSDLFPGN
ncbi:dispanin subfamily A member 2b-like [Notamacropus eugenii]|uniref:Interferon inducible transmembrane protein A2 n=1 Tax=Notamacropus eugenii TaxID=9315 RepID=I1ZHS9_NOTEU|nr:interferon inducible transmembrane protein A2 [Notamacropus eugenii]